MPFPNQPFHCTREIREGLATFEAVPAAQKQRVHPLQDRRELRAGHDDWHSSQSCRDDPVIGVDCELAGIEVEDPICVTDPCCRFAGVDTLRWDEKGAPCRRHVTLSLQLECSGATIHVGDRQCVMDVRGVTVRDERGVQCFDPGKRGRTEEASMLLPLLSRWRATAHTFCGVVQAILPLTSTASPSKTSGH